MHQQLRPTSCVPLQTAQAVVNGSKENTMHMLFDSGSQKIVVTRNVVEKAKLRNVRKGIVGIKTVCSEEIDGKVRNVVESDLRANDEWRELK